VFHVRLYAVVYTCLEGCWRIHEAKQYDLVFELAVVGVIQRCEVILFFHLDEIIHIREVNNCSDRASNDTVTHRRDH